MEKVIFLETDPAFMLAFRAFSELGNARRLPGRLPGRLHHLGTQTAELNPLLSTNGDTYFGGNHWIYDFSRRVSVAARISMCVATRLPLQRNWAKNQHHIEPGIQLQPEGIAFSLGGQHRDDFVAHFDQMFPHHLIQRMLQNQGNSRLLTKKILIFRLENNIPVDIIEMNITINIADVNNFMNMNCSILTTAMKSRLDAGEDGPWYRHLQSICFQPTPQDVHLPCVEAPEQPAAADEDSDED